MGNDAIERLSGCSRVKRGSTIVGHRRYTIEVYEALTYSRIKLEIEWASELEKAQLFGQELVLQLEPPDRRRVRFAVVNGDGDVRVLGGFQDSVEDGA